MQVFYDPDQLPRFRKAVITIGSFDGVHAGHQQILKQVRELAAETGGESVVITFHPHPRLVLYPHEQKVQLLSSTEEKVKLIEQYGIDNLVVVPFTLAFAKQNPEQYIRDFLVGKFHPHTIVFGYDHRFGNQRRGDIHLLRKNAARYGYRVVEIPPQLVDDVAVSSTKIRQAIQQGKIRKATRLLQHYYNLIGQVVPGQKVGGSKLGYPTANLRIANKFKLIPPKGIYAVFVRHRGQLYKGMLYIGTRPTVDQSGTQSIEVHIFNFGLNIYGDKLEVFFVQYLRGDAKFDSLEELKAALDQDKENALDVLQKAHLPKGCEKQAPTAAKVVVALLNHSTRHLLQKFLPPLLKTRYDNFEILLIDNGSTDDSLDWVREHYPQVRIVALPENMGYAKGYNKGLCGIDADYYVLLNTDVEVTPFWLAPVIERMEKEREIAAAQPKIRSWHEREKFEYAGACGGWIDQLGYPFCAGRIFATVEKDEGQYDELDEVFWASGAALFLRSRRFWELGGFDESFFAHMEEIDLCWRYQRAGYKVITVPEAVVYHVGGGTLPYTNAKKAYLNFRNNLSLLYKNLDNKRLKTIFTRLLMDGIAGLYFLSKGELNMIPAIAKAHFHFYGMLLSGSLPKRKSEEDERIRRMSIATEDSSKKLYKKSIVAQYFLKGKKRFSELPDS